MLLPSDVLKPFLRRNGLLAATGMMVATIAFGAEPAIRPASVTAAPGFVYRAEKNGRVMFLASSLHRLRKDAYPLPEAYEIAYGQSQALWFENDPREAGANGPVTDAARKGLMGAGKRVDEMLSESTRRILHAHLASRKIDPAKVRRMRPWYLGMYLMNIEYERLGVRPQNGVDSFFSRRAYLESKPVLGLEKASRTANALHNLSAAEQDRNLGDTLRTAGQIPELYRSLTAAWRQGNEKTALRLLRPGNYASNESWRSIVMARSAAWVDKLDGIASGKPCMVLVGLDHLIGAEGMVSQLAARGYRVTAVKPVAAAQRARQLRNGP